MAVIPSALAASYKAHQPWKEVYHKIRPYVCAAMTRGPLFGPSPIGSHPFLFHLGNELRYYNSGHSQTSHKLDINSILQGVRALMDLKLKRKPTPEVHQVLEQIGLLGQYAILSHRWCPEELTFADAAPLSKTGVRTEQAFHKLKKFRKVVSTYYGSRYLWVDSLCIHEATRGGSIPLMFHWYQNAYVCVVLNEDGWSSRGWTLQEWLAAKSVKFFKYNWIPKKQLFKHARIPREQVFKYDWIPQGDAKFDSYQGATIFATAPNILLLKMGKHG